MVGGGEGQAGKQTRAPSSRRRPAPGRLPRRTDADPESAAPGKASPSLAAVSENGFVTFSFQETFDAGLQAFQQEGIANITALKDQLLAAKHIQSKAIEARHASLMKRWSQLLANSATRKKKLLEAQSHFRKVRLGTGKAQVTQ